MFIKLQNNLYLFFLNFSTIPQLIRHIYTNEGAIGFYKGLSINLIKGPLATGTVWTIKNKLNRKLDKNYDL